MNRDDHARLSHMIEAAQDAQSFLSGKSFNELQDDRQLAFAVVRALEIVGEAASQISQELHDRYSNIKWRDIISMRNIFTGKELIRNSVVAKIAHTAKV